MLLRASDSGKEDMDDVRGCNEGLDSADGLDKDVDENSRDEEGDRSSVRESRLVVSGNGGDGSDGRKRRSFCAQRHVCAWVLAWFSIILRKRKRGRKRRLHGAEHSV